MSDFCCVCGYADYKHFQLDLVNKFVERGECTIVTNYNSYNASQLFLTLNTDTGTGTVQHLRTSRLLGPA